MSCPLYPTIFVWYKTRMKSRWILGAALASALLSTLLPAAPLAQELDLSALPGVRKATQSETQILLTSGLSIPQALVNQGLTQIGDTNLTKFLESMTTRPPRLYLITSDGPFYAGSRDMRTSGLNFVRSRQIMIREEIFQRAQASAEARKKLEEEKAPMSRTRFSAWDVLVLHELLGLEALADQNYTISVGLLRSIPVRPTPSQKTEPKEYVVVQEAIKLARWTTSLGPLAANDGGGTSVGGGGDVHGIQIKMGLLDHLMEMSGEELPHERASELCAAVLQLRVEVTTDMRLYYAEAPFTFDTESNPLTGGYESVLRVNLPQFISYQMRAKFQRYRTELPNFYNQVLKTIRGAQDEGTLRLHPAR